MSAPNRVPPPPPHIGPATPGIILIDEHDMHQVPPMNNPQNAPQNIPQRRGPPNLQRPGLISRSAPQYRPGMIINNSIRTSDIRPRKELSADYCRKQLTTYRVCAMKKKQPPIPESEDTSSKKKEPRRSSFSFKRSKDPPKPKSTWEYVDITDENFSSDEIITKIQKLDRKRSVTDKIAKLTPSQSTQLAVITDEIVNHEPEPHWFEWTLAQLERHEVKKKNGNKETARITCFFKRSPSLDVNVILMYQQRRAHVTQPFPPQPIGQPNGNPMQHPEPVNIGTYQGARVVPARGRPPQDPRRPSVHAPVQIVHEEDRRRKQNSSKPKPNQSGSSESESDSESDDDPMYESDTTPSSYGSAGQRRRKAMSFSRKDRPHRQHDHETEYLVVGRSRGQHENEPGYRVVERPRQNSSVSYAPEVPRYASSRPSYDENALRGKNIDMDALAASIIAVAQASGRLQSTSPGSRRQQILNDLDRQYDEDRRRDLVDEIISRDSTVSPRQSDVEEMLLRRESRRLSELPRRLSTGIPDDYERSRRPSELLRRPLAGIPGDYERGDSRRPSEYARRPSMVVPESDHEYIRNPMSPRDQPTFRYVDRMP